MVLSVYIFFIYIYVYRYPQGQPYIYALANHGAHCSCRSTLLFEVKREGQGFLMEKREKLAKYCKSVVGFKNYIMVCQDLTAFNFVNTMDVQYTSSW